MTIIKNHFTEQHQHVVSVLVLTGTLFLGTGLALLPSAIAAPSNIFQAAADDIKVILLGDRVEQTPWRSLLGGSNGSGGDRLPDEIAQSIRQNLSRQVGISTARLRITDSSRETWPNGCLGLPKPGELCTQALVEGWHVKLSDGRQTWIYRTDRQGRVLRLESKI